jgi:hypothetical protein
MNVLILLNVVDDPEEICKKFLIPAVVKTLNVALDLRELHKVYNDLTGFENFFLDGLPVHTDDTCDDSIGD